jgi:predicted dehydrogenase
VKALIVGFGSIGQRHARLLKPLVEKIATVSSRTVAEHPQYVSLETALQSFTPDLIIIASITAKHSENLSALKRLGFRGRVLVEKPLFIHASESGAPYPFPVYVSYQLRFDPVIVALRDALQGQTIYSSHGYVGKHLSQWRPGRDVRETYSAYSGQGGGAVRDLSHELDLAGHLFGPILEAHAVTARAGNVTADSEDAAAFVMRAKNCPVISLQMNYLDFVPQREWIVTTREASFKADLVAHTLSRNGEIARIACGPDDAYRTMHEAVLAGDAARLCSFKEGLAVMKLIDMAAPINA